jgi:hypothetical protein
MDLPTKTSSISGGASAPLSGAQALSLASCYGGMGSMAPLLLDNEPLEGRESGLILCLMSGPSAGRYVMSVGV